MLTQEGPTHVPERTIIIKAYTTCSGCDYFKHCMIKSGRDPEYHNICDHRDIPVLYKYNGWSSSLFTDRQGIVHTPDWCPFLKSKSDESKIPEKDS